MYTVIYSTDPYLLARMATDLQMVGYEIILKHVFDSVDKNHPFYPGRLNMAINHPEPKKKGISFWVISLTEYNPIRHTLTARNYLKVLGAIANSKK